MSEGGHLFHDRHQGSSISQQTPDNQKRVMYFAIDIRHSEEGYVFRNRYQMLRKRLCILQ